MIYVTDVSQYAFCPYSLYLTRVQRVKVTSPQMVFGSIYHRITRKMEKRQRTVFDIFVNEEMSAEEIAEVFRKDAQKVVKHTVLRNKKKLKKNKLEVIRELNDLFSRKCRENASLLREAMDNYGKKDVYEIVFPEKFTEFPIKSEKLNLSGRVDRIEERGGRYYPEEIKTGRSTEFMEKDMLQLTGYALLLEEEFDTSVDRGVINYVVLNKKHEVSIDTALKRRFLTMKESVEKIFDGHVPYHGKREECAFCSLRKVCQNNEKI